MVGGAGLICNVIFFFKRLHLICSVCFSKENGLRASLWRPISVWLPELKNPLLPNYAISTNPKINLYSTSRYNGQMAGGIKWISRLTFKNANKVHLYCTVHFQGSEILAPLKNWRKQSSEKCLGNKTYSRNSKGISLEVSIGLFADLKMTEHVT